MTTTNEVRRDVMKTAWGLFRSAAASGEPRTFADALAGAWRFIKRLAALPMPRTLRRSTVKASEDLRRFGTAAAIGGKHSRVYLSARMGY